MTKTDQNKKASPQPKDEYPYGTDFYSPTTPTYGKVTTVGSIHIKTYPVEDEAIEENDEGGRNSVIRGRYDLLPPLAIETLAKVMEEGAIKYAPNNWKKVPLADHLNHSIRHIIMFLQTGTEEHLTHAFCRLAMTVSQYYEVPHDNE